MKKFYFITALAFAASTAMAQGIASVCVADADAASLSRSGDGTRKLYVVGSHTTKAAELTDQMETALPSKDEIIKSQPEGTLYKNMYRSANVYVAYGTAATNRVYDGYAGDIVVSADGKKLYMKNPFVKFAPGTWIVGDLDEEGNVEFKFPQAVYHEEGDNGELTGYAWKMSVTGGAIAIDDTSQSVKYKWTGTSLTQANQSEVIGFTNENREWLGYGVFQNTFSTVSEKPAKPTDMSNAADYRMTYYDMSGNTATTLLKVVTEGNDMYIGGIYNPDFWMKGTIDGNTVTFFGPQYLGVNNATTHDYMMPFDIDTSQATEYIEFQYSSALGKMSSKGTIEVNIGKSNLSSLAMYVYPYLEKVNFTVGTPAKPEIKGVMPYGSDPNEPEIAAVLYELNNKTVTGGELNENNIYYRLYLDGELQTFGLPNYRYLKADMTEIPYAFTDSYTNMMNGSKGWDFQVIDGQQYIYIYKPFSQVALQAVYEDGDKLYESQLANYTVTAINDAVSDEATVTGVTYHDLSGRTLTAPAKGISLKTITYANGQTKTVKVMK